MADYSTARVETKRDFAEFLESDYGHATGEGKYIRQIDDIIKNYPSTQSARLIVDLQGAHVGAGGRESVTHLSVDGGCIDSYPAMAR